jgi:hypothetical protein
MPQIQVGGHRLGTKGTEKFAEVDEDDFERVSKYKWSSKIKNSHSTTYATSSFGSTHNKTHTTYLHRFIMGLGDYKDDKRIINHIDGNGLNNCKNNLEICDNLYNSQSFRRHHGNSNVGSVSFDKRGRKKCWGASININKIRYIKYFETEQEGKDFISSLIDAAHLKK